LVRENYRQLPLRVDDAEEPARDEDVSPGQRERVWHRVVDDAEGPGELRALR
jgi:hypothetical protein